MTRDPFDSPADRIGAALRQWGVYLVVGTALLLFVLGGLFATAGKDHLISGTVVRIEQTGTKQLTARAIVRLDDGQVTVDLPSKTNCRTGSTIKLIRRDNMVGRSFRAALAACAN
ncbi:hypothetical protein [Sphingopyxis sp. GW247-27LB]|uniref:hypothetical protein n=1 Tax=Sphingopyxis sp. GW247-27LB TaxID=2012632 RepID=UPI001140AA41|nr:hypothetical protein [Sphingopyxis sp. GW247-27LB]